MLSEAKAIRGIRNIIVCSPAALSGGPELLHQLVSMLNRKGFSAHIAYYPFGGFHNTPEMFKKYNVSIGSVTDSEDTLIVLPETATRLSFRFKKSRIAIWWLSVDNYFRITRNSPVGDILQSGLSLVRHRAPMFMLRGYFHFAQSEYARSYLLGRGIHALMLSDYLGEEHLSMSSGGGERRNIVVYNPKKGREITSKLIRCFPEIDFVPIQGLSAAEVADLLGSAKLYIDFGSHPGKDRIPREAAMAGCCVITGRKGSAAFSEDVSILPEYKLDEHCKDFMRDFGRLVEDVFENYQIRSRDFDGYREKILAEPMNFERQVVDVFEKFSSRNVVR